MKIILAENDSDLQVGTSSICGHPSESSSGTQSSGAIVGDNLRVQQPNVLGASSAKFISCKVAESVLELVGDKNDYAASSPYVVVIFCTALC